MTRRRAQIGLCAAALAAALGAAPEVRADRYEASIAARPAGQLARLADRGTTERALVLGAGLAGGLSWGVRNWLDVGAELSAGAFGEATYEPATLPVAANPRTGTLTRRTRIAQLRALATLRLGVGWVPTIQLAAGAGARQRSAARLETQVSQATLVLVPDGEAAALTLDLVTALRIGLDRRMSRHWTIGASVGAAHCFGVGAPDMQLADAVISISYNWYHLWW
jgi:hypothetical protein